MTGVSLAPQQRARRRWLSIGGIAVSAVLALAACGTNTATTSSASRAPTPEGSAAASSGHSASGGPNATVTVSAAQVPGVGTVLVNGSGRTLYILSSEAGGQVTCVDANGCTKVWTDSEIPRPLTTGVAGPGVQASLLGAAKGPTGDSYVTYAGYPLYAFTHDAGPGSAQGEGIMSFGGTWHVITPEGTLGIKATAGPAASPTPRPSPSKPSSSGYGY